MSAPKVRKKYIPAWCVVRTTIYGGYCHVLAVFEELTEAEVYADKCTAEYDRTKVELMVQIQAADFCSYV